MSGTLILALDLATTTGFAIGKPFQMPRWGTIRFGKPGASNNAIFAHAMDWITALLDPIPRPSTLILESLLPPDAKVGKTSRDVRDRLCGLQAIVRAVAHKKGIYDISEAGPQTVRKHFIGDGMLKRELAKAAVMQRCRQLGWDPQDDNAGDALALFSFACAIINPEWSLQLSPLFNRQLRAAE